MTGGKILDRITIKLANRTKDDFISVEIDIFDNSLSRKWLDSLNHVLSNDYLLEKNYCFLGFPESDRNGWYILDQVNRSIQAINQAELGYTINDHFSMDDCLGDEISNGVVRPRSIVHDRFNWLHRYFEDLQGVSGKLSPFYVRADANTRWHIRQLNLLCHEFESWALSYRKQIEAPEWVRPSQLMCWLHAPRFQLEEEDYELFGIETLNRSLGGVYVGVNKAVGKQHWEVFIDEGKDSRVGELTSTSMRSQTEAAADFDIEWANDPGAYHWQKQRLIDFRKWLIDNGFNPDDKALTIGHPKIGQTDLVASFGTEDYRTIWKDLNKHLDVVAVITSACRADYPYHWSDSDFQKLQVSNIEQGRKNEMA